MKKTEKGLSECVGAYAGEFVNLYPPGVPVLAPGERITEEIREHIDRWLAQGLTVQGIEWNGKEYRVKVLSHAIT